MIRARWILDDGFPPRVSRRGEIGEGKFMFAGKKFTESSEAINLATAYSRNKRLEMKTRVIGQISIFRFIV